MSNSSSQVNIHPRQMDLVPAIPQTSQRSQQEDDRSHNYQRIEFQEHILIGGVDVSFPKDEATEDAVAVYICHCQI